jgi:hypothetical protein
MIRTPPRRPDKDGINLLSLNTLSLRDPAGLQQRLILNMLM